jgi:hypothetical protein
MTEYQSARLYPNISRELFDCTRVSCRTRIRPILARNQLPLGCCPRSHRCGTHIRTVRSTTSLPYFKLHAHRHSLRMFKSEFVNPIVGLPNIIRIRWLQLAGLGGTDNSRYCVSRLMGKTLPMSPTCAELLPIALDTPRNTAVARYSGRCAG